MSRHVAQLHHEEVAKERPDLFQRQHELEAEARDLAYIRVDIEKERKGAFNGSPTARKVRVGLINNIADRLLGYFNEQESMDAGRKQAAYRYLKMVEPECLAYVCLRVLWDDLAADKGKGSAKFTACSMRIGKRLKEAVDFEVFSAANPGLSTKLQRQLDRTASERHRRAVLSKAMSAADYESTAWEPAHLAAIGATLIECAVEATGLFRVVQVREGRSTPRIIFPTESFVELLSDAEFQDPIMNPYRLPMLIPPVPWVDMYNGGFLNQQGTTTLVRSKAAQVATLDGVEMPAVLEAVNTVQATPWRVNASVYEVAKACHEEGISVPGLSSRTAPSMPEKPWGEGESPTEQQVSEWKAVARDAYSNIASWTSKRLVQSQTLGLADRFLGEEAIYFPHSLDFRGRVYPEAGIGAMNPQGNDLGKSLLEFSRGKRVTDDGFRWLLIHAANSYGVDKVSLLDRELWAMFWMDSILECARSPIDFMWWSKADKPWAFLAVCFELEGYLSDPEGFLSHLPVSVDGSCSGLQHYAALLRCEKTASAVNVKPSEGGPSDVYTTILDRTFSLVQERENEGEGIAREWKSRLRRQVVKQPVMTTPYGVTSRGIVGQIKTNTDKLIGKNSIPEFPGEDTMSAAIWLGPLVEEAIDAEVHAAVAGMEWLERVAKVTSKAGLPLHWETPVGFLVLQDYRKTKGKKLDFSWAGQRIRMTLHADTSDLDRRKQAASVAPNFIHSMDAAHLMATVNNSYDYGIRDFAMVHDSYGCHASDVPLLSEVLRECFIAMYSGDVLGELQASISEGLSEEEIARIGDPPPTGSLDLEAVRDSLYFFA